MSKQDMTKKKQEKQQRTDADGQESQMLELIRCRL